MTEHKPYKGPINQPCSACSAGDTAMEYHDHDYVREENRRKPERCPSCGGEHKDNRRMITSLGPVVRPCNHAWHFE